MPPKSKKSGKKTPTAKNTGEVQMPKAEEGKRPTETIKYGVKITVEKIENVVTCRVPLEAFVRLLFKKKVVCQSSTFNIIEQAGAMLEDIELTHYFDTIDLETMDSLVDNPYMLVLVVNQFMEMPGDKAEGLAKTPKSKKATTASKKLGAADESTADLPVIGQATLDILPLLLGEREMSETLLLEADKQLTGGDLLVHSQLARMIVKAIGLDFCLMDYPSPFVNILYLTVESVYNTPAAEVPPPPPGWNNAFAAATVVPARKPPQVSFQEAGSDLPEQTAQVNKDYEVLKFEYSTVETYPQPDGGIKWNSLADVQGRSALTKYCMLYDGIDEIKNSVGVDLEKTFGAKKQRVQFNGMKRYWLTPDVESEIYKRITQYKCWPFEFVLTTVPEEKDYESRPTSKGSSKGSNDSKGSKKSKASKGTSKEVENPDVPRFIALVDVDRLLCGGETSTRVASQLMTYSKSYVKEKCGVDGPFIVEEEVVPVIPEETAPAPGKSKKGKKGETAAAKSKQKSKKLSKSESVQEIEVVEKEEPEPEPTPVMSSDGRPLFVVVRMELRKPFFNRRKTTEDIEFRMGPADGRKASDDFELDENNFFSYLQSCGAYAIIQETLRDKLVSYIRDAIGTPREGCNEIELQNYISSLYVQLVREINYIINNEAMKPGKRCCTNRTDETKTDSSSEDTLLYYACEAAEQMQYDIAQKYLFKTTHFNDFQTAEVFFEALTHFHPRFVEGWLACHIYFGVTDRSVEAEVALIQGTRCMHDMPAPKFNDDIPVLSWDTGFATESNAYHTLILYLLKHNLVQFAEVALSKELNRIQPQESVPSVCHYLIAVCHYLKTSYMDSNWHLGQASEAEWQTEGRWWSLMGHNFNALGKQEEVIISYERAIVLNEEHNQLLALRLGYMYLNWLYYDEAKISFMRSVRNYPTPLGWLGLGITLYNLGEISDAELCLSEANQMNDRLPEVWAYLALINLSYGKNEEFFQCLQQSKQYGRLDKELENMIENMSKGIMCYDPCVITENTEGKDGPLWEPKEVDVNIATSRAYVCVKCKGGRKSTRPLAGMTRISVERMVKYFEKGLLEKVNAVVDQLAEGERLRRKGSVLNREGVREKIASVINNQLNAKSLTEAIVQQITGKKGARSGSKWRMKRTSSKTAPSKEEATDPTLPQSDQDDSCRSRVMSYDPNNSAEDDNQQTQSKRRHTTVNVPYLPTTFTDICILTTDPESSPVACYLDHIWSNL
ncbi:hypothetical protein AAG570_006532 [Ranatra chinensis]|uniref:Uncharacterized protein n=1 Tax=Ranatra chinensis TaxID=642074 RepID=A0ABD0YWD8_9HEMI